VVVNQAFQNVVQNVGRQRVLIYLTGFEFSARRLSEDIGRIISPLPFVTLALVLSQLQREYTRVLGTSAITANPIHIAVEGAVATAISDLLPVEEEEAKLVSDRH